MLVLTCAINTYSPLYKQSSEQYTTHIYVCIYRNPYVLRQ